MLRSFVLLVLALAWTSTAMAAAALAAAPPVASAPPPAALGAPAFVTCTVTRRQRRGGLSMRHRPTGQEKDEAIADKQIKEKQSQVLLAQRVQHIKRLRQARREEIVQTEWYAPKQPNHDWRNAFAEGAAGLSTAAVGGSAEAPVVDEVSEMIVLKAERGSGGAVVNVYAREEAAVTAAAAAAAATVALNPDGAGAGTTVAVRPALKRGDYAPLVSWRELRYIDDGGREMATSFNRIRNGSRCVVVLAGVTAEGLVTEGLKRMRIVPPHVAAVVGVSPTGPLEAVRLVKKHGLAPGSFLSDVDRRWLAAHGVGGPRSLRPMMMVLDGARGVVLVSVRDPPPGSVNDLLAEMVGDWRGD